MASAPPPQPVRPTAQVPVAQATTPAYDPAYPPQLGPGGVAADDAPPSYEDAMADEAVVVDGNRREYSGVTDVNAPEVGEKGGKGGGLRQGGPPPGYGSH